MGILTDFLLILRASNPEFRVVVQEALANVTNTLPTAGNDNKGTAFAQTGPTDLREQRRLMLLADANDTTLPFAGL